MRWMGSTPLAMPEKAYNRQQGFCNVLFAGEYPAPDGSAGTGNLPVIAWEAPGLGDPADQQRRLLRYQRQSTELGQRFVCPWRPARFLADQASG